MDSNLLEMINRRIDDLKQDNEKRFDSLDEKFGFFDDKLDALLKFKWQIIGGTGVIALFATIFFQVILALIQRGG